MKISEQQNVSPDKLDLAIIGFLEGSDVLSQTTVDGFGIGLIEDPSDFTGVWGHFDAGREKNNATR
jgi:hypothetical protein